MARSPDLTPFGRLVDRFRKKRGLRTDQLANLVGVSRTTMYRQLTGQSEISALERQAYRRVLEIPAEAAALVDTPASVHDATSVDALVNDLELTPFAADVERMARLLDTGLQYRSITPLAVRAVLNGIEEAARLDGQSLTTRFWELRRSVHEQLAKENAYRATPADTEKQD